MKINYIYIYIYIGINKLYFCSNYGMSMVYPWYIHMIKIYVCIVGLSINFLWYISGKFMVYLWYNFEIYIKYLYFFFGFIWIFFKYIYMVYLNYIQNIFIFI